MNSENLEGVIKFELMHTRKSFPASTDLDTLIAWRAVLHRLRLIGQDPRRYGGLGFGNISQRIEHVPAGSNQEPRFVISGTQTGAAEHLDLTQFSTVTGFSIPENRIIAEGPVKPSSEALTHAAVYHCRPDIRFIIHGHSPDIWRATHSLSLPCIEKSIAYGTVEMADAVQNLIQSQGSHTTGIFSMLGHEDGIVAYASEANAAGNLLVETLVRALTVNA
jgi:Class II Aldolase and Adducin N-terminal domain